MSAADLIVIGTSIALYGLAKAVSRQIQLAVIYRQAEEAIREQIAGEEREAVASQIEALQRQVNNLSERVLDAEEEDDISESGSVSVGRS